jgi:hypothetical protein
MKKLLLLIAATCAIAQAQVVDQQQTVSNNGLSARGFTSYSNLQSFTAGITGNLVRIDLQFFGRINGTCSLVVRAGAPNEGGSVLWSGNVPVVSTRYSWNNWAVGPVPVVAGQVYHFELTPVSMPDPFGLSLGGQPGPYTAGTYYYRHGSPIAYAWPIFSMVFRTWVQ